ncbi:polysaccharide deacetylase family protein [Paenibacillus sp. 1P07SE]|uniref:polysaccharide deacetylase family protein n=1 Tax=Paenibacillus sp. 1P07SE TaxID=3132209 RepID=UPI0039A6823E
MNRTTHPLGGALLALALLAGCSAGPGETKDSPPPQLEEQPEKTPVSESATPEETDTLGQESPGSEVEPNAAEPEPDVPGDPPLEIQYEMNDASYRFTPLSDEVDADAVLLTFDDGPKERALLERMLAILDKHSAKAIFFVNGYRVEQQPELLQLVSDNGHMIGNHAWDHIDLRKAEPQEARRQIDEVQTIVSEVTGEAPRFFRPPFGSGGDAVKEMAAEQGLLYMTWSNGSRDWENAARDNPEVVISSVMEQLHPGANILMHELPWTADALDELLGLLTAKGYSFIDPATIKLPDRPAAAE